MTRMSNSHNDFTAKPFVAVHEGKSRPNTEEDEDQGQQCKDQTVGTRDFLRTLLEALLLGLFLALEKSTVVILPHRASD